MYIAEETFLIKTLTQGILSCTLDIFSKTFYTLYVLNIYTYFDGTLVIFGVRCEVCSFPHLCNNFCCVRISI